MAQFVVTLYETFLVEYLVEAPNQLEAARTAATLLSHERKDLRRTATFYRVDIDRGSVPLETMQRFGRTHYMECVYYDGVNRFAGLYDVRTFVPEIINSVEEDLCRLP